MINKAILVVSFGTTHKDTREKTIEAIENQVGESFKDYKIYRAFTSKIIMKILGQRDGLYIDNVSEAMERMRKDGIKELIILPTHIINGIENDTMIEDVRKNSEGFESIIFSSPLLTADKDYEELVDILGKEYSELARNTFLNEELSDIAVVLMGHGTEHYVNTAYAALDYRFKARGYENIYLACVEGYPYIEDLIPYLKKKSYKAILLVPFMVVAGEHAKNDMAGEEEDSWSSILKKEGYKTISLIKGLGEYEAVRAMFIKHALIAIENNYAV